MKSHNYLTGTLSFDTQTTKTHTQNLEKSHLCSELAAMQFLLKQFVSPLVTK